MSHTPEPWSVPQPIVDGAGLPFAPVFATTLIAKVYSTALGDTDQATANARRIVACVNACAGIPIEVLEEGGQGTVTASMARLTEQRDKLLAVCEELSACAEYWSEYDVPLGIVERLDAAIAEAKGQK